MIESLFTTQRLVKSQLPNWKSLQLQLTTPILFEFQLTDLQSQIEILESLVIFMLLFFPFPNFVKSAEIKVN